MATGEKTELARVLHVVGVPDKHFAVINRRLRGYFLTHVLGRRRPGVNSDPIGHQPRLLKTDAIIEVAGKNHRFFIND